MIFLSKPSLIGISNQLMVDHQQTSMGFQLYEILTEDPPFTNGIYMDSCGISMGYTHFFRIVAKDSAEPLETHLRDTCGCLAFSKGTMWGPLLITWFINPRNTIFLSTINHSYWSYKAT